LAFFSVDERWRSTIFLFGIGLIIGLKLRRTRNIKTTISSHAKKLAIVLALICSLLALLPQQPAEATPLTCVQGGVCVVGDTGPGGGTVFYVAPSIFNCGAMLNQRCLYLEYAPTTGTNPWTDVNIAWSGETSTAISTTSSAIGTGYKNTLAMVTQPGGGSTANRAGTLTRAYRGPNNLTDWYLHSLDELDELRSQSSDFATGFGGLEYWSSTESSSRAASFITNSGIQDAYKEDLSPYVRPIRAFGPVTYAITLAAGTNGSGGGTTLTKTNGVSLTLEDSNEANTFFTRAGYRVTGWTTSDGGAQTHALSGTFTTDANTTLYPVWTLISNIGACELLVNGSFEIPSGIVNSEKRHDATNNDIPGIGWITTETDADPTRDHQIEFWASDYYSVPAVNGSQFIEMNGSAFSGIYQDVATSPGATLTWSLSHRGRNGFDQMAVRIGPASGSVALPLAGNSLLIRQGDLLRDSNSAWGTYSGSYVVPAGQRTTRFYLESVSVYGTPRTMPDDDREIFNTEEMNIGAGNFVDNVTLTASTCGEPAPEAPAYVEPTPIPYLKSVTSPKLNLKDGKLICTAGTYQTGYTFGSEAPSGGASNFTPSSYIYKLLVNGAPQTSLTRTSTSHLNSWDLLAFPSISTLMPVSIGNASSLPAATATCATDSENVFAFTEPLVFGSGGS
jgi:hypothetical protein